MATINVKDAADTTVAIEKPLAPSRASAALSRPVVLSNEDKTALDLLVTSAQIGEVQASPTANTVLDRLKAIVTALSGTVTVAAHAVTQSGSWVLSAGSAVIGKVGIDQTTDGTTNLVAAKQSGTWNIGSVTTLPVLTTGTNNIGHVGGTEYETVAASQTDQMLGPTGAAGDYLSHLLVIPATTSPGNVLIEDGAISNVAVFTGGAASVSNLVPFVIPIGAKSVSGGWEITTGANVSVIAFGDFT